MNCLPGNKSSHFSECLMAVDAVLTSVVLGSPLPLRASQMCAWMKQAWKDYKNCLRNEKQTSITCSRMKKSLVGYLFRWLSTSCICLQYPGLALTAHLLSHLWHSSSSKRACALKLRVRARVISRGTLRGRRDGLRWTLVHRGFRNIKSAAVCGDI